jgi:hypothetical protein
MHPNVILPWMWCQDSHEVFAWICEAYVCIHYQYL